MVCFSPLLTYVIYSLGNSPVEHIVKACKEYYVLEEIVEAKDALWKIGDSATLGPYAKRRDGKQRPEVEAHMLDIVEGMQKLDSAGIIPQIACDPKGLGRIPSVKPSETCSISLAEKVAALESKLQAAISDHKADMGEMHARVNSMEARIPSYAEKVTAKAKESPVKAKDNQPVSAPKPHVTADNQLQVKLPPLVRSEFGSQQSLASSAPSGFKDGFRYITQQKKKMHRRKKIVTGTSQTNGGSKLKGAPEPSRFIFIYRVDKNADCADIQEYMNTKDITIRSISKLSKDESKFNSFKAEIKVTDLDDVLEPYFWPEGIYVRRFYAPRQQKKDSEW